jgi:pimeloyl-ACP methyl ester carboxylesterase
MTHPALTRFPAIEVSANGLRFHVRTAGEGERLALLLHGFPESWFSWREQMPLLARLGYRVWAPDLRGYGATERPRGVRAYRMSELLADVAGLIDAAAPREVLLVAHDWGGAIAWEFVARRVRPVDRFVVMNVGHPVIFARYLRRPSRQMLRSYYMFLFQLPLLPEWLLSRRNYRAIDAAFLDLAVDRRRFPPEVLEVYRRNAAQPGALTAMINYYRAAARGRDALFPRRSRIETPTLMIWGEEDKVLGKELTIGTEDFVEHLTLRYVPNASHWVQQEAPEIVNALLEAWLTGRPVPEAWEVGGSEPASAPSSLTR